VVEQQLPKVSISSRIISLQELIGTGREFLEPFGSFAVVLNMVLAQYPCGFQRNTIFHTIEP